MLLRFGVENFLSIREYQEVNLTATRLSDDAADLIVNEKLTDSVLPAIALYGANASGKSNIIKAFDFLISGIIDSFSHSNVKKDTPSIHFELDEACKNKPSRFDIDFFFNDVRYHYGFVLKEGKIHEEWLYAYPFSKRQIWFHRQTDESPVFYFGKHLKGKNKTIVELTKSNSLFLSTAAEANHFQLGLIYGYFKEKYEIIIDLRKEGRHLNKYLTNEAVKQFFIDFLKFADTGILDIKIEEEKPELDRDALPEDLKTSVTEFESALKKYSETAQVAFPKKAHVVSLGHKAKNDETVYFHTSLESRGTIALLDLLGPVIVSIATGSILFIDEIDSSLHPLVSKRLISLFNNNKVNNLGAQLVFTTHDTNLLSSSLLRRDQVWFSEKSSEGVTHIYPLSNIRTRKNDNLEKGYLQGRFGAIPFIGSIEDLTVNEVK